MALTKAIETRLRERELAGDVRAGSFARGNARTAQRAYLRRHWRAFAGLAAISLSGGLIACLAMPTDLLKGVVLGVVLAGVPGVIWSWTLQVTGTAPLMMGDQAEQWTAQELRRHRRAGWRVVNHFRRESDDVDHIFIGPGGVYAVETKWSAEWESDYGQRRVQSAARLSAGKFRTMFPLGSHARVRSAACCRAVGW